MKSLQTEIFASINSIKKRKTKTPLDDFYNKCQQAEEKSAKLKRYHLRLLNLRKERKMNKNKQSLKSL
jgi:hypothetical protein